jgi:hypothetical protein
VSFVTPKHLPPTLLAHFVGDARSGRAHVERMVHFLELMSMTGLRNASAPFPKRGRVRGDGSNPSPLQVTTQGYGLIAELTATVLLIAALTGFFLQRSKPWLISVTAAFMILIVAATVIIASST